MVVATEKKARFSRSKFLKSREWSQYQQSLFDFGVAGSGHGIVNAVAGSGKSTSLVGLVASLPASSKIAVVAFNNHSVADLAAKMPSTISVSTAHKFGMSSLFRYFGEPFKPNDEKMRDLCRCEVLALIDRIVRGSDVATFTEMDLLVYGTKSKDRVTVADSKALRRLAAAYLESIIHFAMASLYLLDVMSLVEMADYFCVDHDFSDELAYDVLLPLVGGLIERSVVMAIEKQNVSLDELLYLPVRLKLGFPAYDFVLQDEAQDASNCMMAMIGNMASSGRLISVGDKFQSIQGFTGAAADSFDRIVDTFNPTKLDLSICYRCPSSHLDLARRLVPGIQDKPGAIQGSIFVVAIDNVARLARMGDLMLCRFTAPLVEMCLGLIGRGIKAMVRGRDIGSQFTALVEKVGGLFPEKFLDGLQSYLSPRISRLVKDEDKVKLQALIDRRDAVITCFESFGFECGNRDEFCKKILNLFCSDDEKPPVTLATIHRSKGDEADRVWILGSDLLPFTKKARHDWQVQQELNLTYVALTRSKSDLFLVPIGENAENMIKHPLGGMDLPMINVDAVEVLDFPGINSVVRVPDKEAIERITNRFAAYTNNQSESKYVLTYQPQLYVIPAVPQRTLDVGVMVAMFCNPRNAGRIVAMDGDMISVSRGGKIFEIEAARCKALIPLGGAIDE